MATDGVPSRTPASFFSGYRTISTAGEPEPVTNSGTIANWIILQSDKDNTDILYVGDKKEQLLQLSPGESVSLEVNDLAHVYVNSSNTGARVNYVAGIDL